MQLRIISLFMKKQRQKPKNRSDLKLQRSIRLNPTGTVLVYVVVLMLIFGILGVVMVSLFSSSIASSITRNDSRRARQMAESGTRYAFSELRKNDFDIDIMIDPLNTLTYNLSDGGSFDINVFSTWFESSGNQTLPSDGPQLTLNVPIGELPDGYTVPGSGIYAINYEFTGNNLFDETGSWALVSDFGFDPTNPTLTLSGDFNASSGERISLAILPQQAQNINGPGLNLRLPLEAKTIFPKYGGAISIIKSGRYEYFYEERIDYPDRIVLRNLTPGPGSNYGASVETTEASSSWIILSPRNYMVTSTGQSDGTTYGGDFTFARGISDLSLIRPLSAPPDITADEFTTDLSEQETDTRLFETNTVEDTLRIGRALTDQFGSAFYAGDQSIGGDQDYCQQGACLFGLGVRVFFLMNFSQQGDGITFTLTSFGPALAPHNSASSVGGDVELSELMGYAGDSRLVPNANPLNSSDFLATDPNDRGLDPPKIAVEFDTRTNNTAGDPPPDYCSGANANANTRNDPVPDSTANKDAVQYVFWGKTSGLIIPCRDNNASYDDNRHDAVGGQPIEEWRFSTAGTVSYWRPGIGSDGTIYMSARDATLYALNEDGTIKWTFNLGDNNEYMPGIDTKGTSDPSDDVIYSDIAGNSLVAIDWEGNQVWRLFVGADIDSTPIVDSAGTIYFGTDGPTNSLFAVNPGGTVKWQFGPPDSIGVVQNVPALNSDASVVYFVALDPDTANDNAMLYAVRTTDGIELWRFPVQAENNELTSSPTVDTKGTADPADDVIYVGDDDNFVYALKPAARIADPTGVGGVNAVLGEWQFSTNGEIESSAAVDPNDGTVYIGSDDGNVWAIASDGTEKWRFPTVNEVESSPIVDLDGTVYIGSRNGNVYAFKPDARLADPMGVGGLNATAGEWAFPTGGPVLSSPALGQAGFIHIGSDDTNFYTISQFADPRNFKLQFPNFKPLIPDEKAFLTSDDLDSSVLVNSNIDWLNGAGSKGSWAVRLEVDRAPLPNADGEFDYELRLWMRQCPDPTDIPCDEILGTFYQDTRIEYNYTAVEDLPMLQKFSLSGAEQDAFERFFFGFTGAAGAEALDVNISQFQLSFIRPGDPVVDCDRANWPLEDSPPLPDCLQID